MCLEPCEEFQTSPSCLSRDEKQCGDHTLLTPPRKLASVHGPRSLASRLSIDVGTYRHYSLRPQPAGNAG